MDERSFTTGGMSCVCLRSSDARDLRSGMALIAAALAAEGESVVTPLETVERGYASLVDRLRSLGAQVERDE